MRILNYLKSFMGNQEFPHKIKKHWYCGSWYIYLGDLKDKGEYNSLTLNPPNMPTWATDRVAFNPFRTGHASDDTSGLIDGLIPATRIGDKIGLYRQVGKKYRASSFYDGAPWDDGYYIDLVFVRAIPVSQTQ